MSSKQIANLAVAAGVGIFLYLHIYPMAAFCFTYGLLETIEGR